MGEGNGDESILKRQWKDSRNFKSQLVKAVLSR